MICTVVFALYVLCVLIGKFDIPVRDGRGPYLYRWHLLRVPFVVALRTYARRFFPPLGPYAHAVVRASELLTRVRSRTPAVFLHRTFRADPGRDVHNHPWPWAGTFVLWGGYVQLIKERLPTGYYSERFVRVDRWTWHRDGFYPNQYHRIVSVKPNTWTLFVTGPRLRDWGFLVRGAHIRWRPYLGLPADAELND